MCVAETLAARSTDTPGTLLPSPYLDLNVEVEQQSHQLRVLVLDGGDERGSVQRVHAVDVEHFRFVFVFLQQPGRAGHTVSVF